MASGIPIRKHCWPKLLVFQYSWLPIPLIAQRLRYLHEVGWRCVKWLKRGCYRENWKNWRWKNLYYWLATQPILRLSWPIQTLDSSEACPSPYFWSCYWSQTWYATTLGANLPPHSEAARSPSQIPQRYAQTGKDLPKQVSGRCTNSFGSKIRLSLKTSSGLPWLKQGYGTQQIPYPLNDWIKRSGSRYPDFHNEPEGWLSFNKNTKRRWIENSFPNLLWPLLIPSYAFWISLCTRHLSYYDKWDVARISGPGYGSLNR